MNLPDDYSSLPVGASFLRADMHIHSFGGSHDVKDPNMTPENIVDEAQRQGLGIIAITDHNEIVNVQKALTAAHNTSVLVVPGVELSTPQGHLLVYFETVDQLSRFYGRIEIADRGTQNSRCQTSVLDCLKLLDSTPGFAILAHVDGASGFDKEVLGHSPHKSDVLTQRALLGIEVLSHQSTISYSEDDSDPNRAKVASLRREALGDGRGSLARVLFSDSHTLNALGRNAQGAKRLTRIKVDQATFDSIRIALMEPDARVRLEDELPESFPAIAAVGIQGGFLDGQKIRFSKNLTCLIGGRGTGKSTLLEVLRAISPNPSGNAVVDSEVWPDHADIFWHDASGGYYTLTRRRDREVENATDPFGPTTFTVECYGQGEAAQTGRLAQSDPSALLRYLDQFIPFRDAKTREQNARRSLEENGETIIRLEREVQELPELRRLLRHTEQQLKDLADANARQLIDLERRVADDSAVRKQVSAALEEIRRRGVSIPVGEQFGEMLARVEAREDYSATAGAVGALAQALRRASAAVEPVRKQAEAVVGEARRELMDLVSQWKAQESLLLTQIDEKRRELSERGIKLDPIFIRTLAQREAEYRSRLSVLQQRKGQLTEALRARKQLLQERWAARDDISAVRAGYADRATKALKGSMADLSVTVRFTDGAYSPEAAQILQRAMEWRTVLKAAAITKSLTVRKFLEAVGSKDHGPIVGIKDQSGQAIFSATEAKAIVAKFDESSRLRFELERVVIEDLPRIVVSVVVSRGKGGSQEHRREFGALSLGQQQSVLLSLMLTSKSTAPLLIDQPEDNLDGEFIFRSLVPALRRAKERRQVIIVTHNPNIAVLGDAELIVALRTREDRGSVVARGSIDAPDSRRMACRILEGAEAAFVRRAKIYGLPK